jgi:transcriptional activator of cad operon
VKSLDNSVIHIGAWRVDPALDEISKEGQTVKLEPKMMRLLACLAEHAGQVVSVEQLLDEVWKDVSRGGARSPRRLRHRQQRL